MQVKPGQAAQWSVRSQAKVTRLGQTTLRKLWESHGPKLHHVETFKLSSDSNFEAKLVDIVLGL